MTETGQTSAHKPRVGLFVTCLVDLVRPGVGFAAVRLLEQAGCEVEVPETQTCCGQPAYNSGDRRDAAAIAARVVETFEPYDYVVAPSGSCAGMLRRHYADLLADDVARAPRLTAFCDKTYELISFLTDVMGVETVDARYDGTATYHDSCAGLRELGIKDQPRRLLQSVEGLTLVEMTEPEICCGFGGTFAVKFSELSNAIVEKKAADISNTQADLLLAGDLGCLMNMVGKLQRQGRQVSARHVAEILAGATDGPAIGEGSDNEA